MLAGDEKAEHYSGSAAVRNARPTNVGDAASKSINLVPSLPRIDIPIALPEAQSAAGSGGSEIGDPRGDGLGNLDDSTGALIGLVAHASTGHPLADVLVRVDIAGAEPVTATTDDRGAFVLPVPEIPDYFAVSAALPGFSPVAVNVPGARVRGRSYRQDFQLAPLDDSLIAIEDAPEVHHLGNDAFEGAINSQFQREAEGRVHRARFTLSEQQIANLRSAAIVLLAKGVQCPHPVSVNGQRVEARFARSPADGSFGEQVIAFPGDWLNQGENVIEIRTSNCSGDLDDFEFINLRVRLNRAAQPAAPPARSTRAT